MPKTISRKRGGGFFTPILTRVNGSANGFIAMVKGFKFDEIQTSLVTTFTEALGNPKKLERLSYILTILLSIFSLVLNKFYQKEQTGKDSPSKKVIAGSAVGVGLTAAVLFRTLYSQNNKNERMIFISKIIGIVILALVIYFAITWLKSDRETSFVEYAEMLLKSFGTAFDQFKPIIKFVAKLIISAPLLPYYTVKFEYRMAKKVVSVMTSKYGPLIVLVILLIRNFPSIQSYVTNFFKSIVENYEKNKQTLKTIKNYEDVLNLKSNSTKSDLSKAYHRLALMYHPDKNVSKTDAEKEEAVNKMEKINEAYDFLKDVNKYK